MASAFRVVVIVPLVAALGSYACKRSSTEPTAASEGLLSVSMSASSVAGGTPVTATVTLISPAPSQGAVVTIASSTAAAIVPDMVTVQGGALSQTFEIQTTQLAVTATATITATYAGTSATATFTIGRLALLALSLSSSSVVAGSSSLGTVTLSGPAPPDGAQVLLASDNPVARVPASVTVPPGDTTQVFDIQTVDVPQLATALLTATLPYSGSARTATFTVARLAISAISFGIGEIPGGVPLAGTVTLTVAAPTGGVSVTLASSSQAASVPPTVTIPEGGTSTTFDVITTNTPPTTVVAITASYATSSQTANLTVIAYPVVSGLSCSPATVAGGSSTTCSGLLIAAAPAEGWQLAIATNDDSLAGAVPSRVSVPAGETTFSFDVITAPVASTTVATIQVTDVPSRLILFTKALAIAPP